MITYTWTWKGVLILSYDLNTSRTLFLVLIDVSLWDVYLEAEFVRSLNFACVKGTSWSSSSGLYASSPATKVMSLCSKSELYSILPSGSGTGRYGPWGIGLIAEGTSGYQTWCLFLRFIPFRFIIQKEQPVLFPLDDWNGKWHTLHFTILSIPQVFLTCSTIKMRSKWLILIP